MTLIVDIVAEDIRFPTSTGRRGSDAMHLDPDYSAAYVTLLTDENLQGCGFAFTLGRGNELCVAAINSFRSFVVGRELSGIIADMRTFWRALTSDSQLRWLGPEKGVVHLATAALVNAVWDLYAKSLGQPLWQVLVDMDPRDLVGMLDFRYITDALTPDEAVDLLVSKRPGNAARLAGLLENGLPAYTTSAGWLRYDDAELEELTRAALKRGWSHVKMKVGMELGDDLRRAAILRRELGPDGRLMLDANQKWDVDQAITMTRAFRSVDPWWIEEPTSPDDICGHRRIASAVTPVRVATGEHVPNRVMFKQLLQADAIGVCQIDCCRLGGVNEVILVLLLAAKFRVPVCPHAGGVGLCELVQHVATFDHVCLGSDLAEVMVEYVDELHEHFVDPVTVRDGRYLLPTLPGYSTTMCSDSRATYAFPGGSFWRCCTQP